MQFVASLEMLPSMLELINAQLKKMACTSKERHQIEVSVEEALVNVINYAYCESPGKVEIVCISPALNQIEIVIKDWGIPFNPETFANRIQKDLSLEERKVGGLGVYFMHQLMDAVSYKREGGANILTMVKKINPEYLADKKFCP
ncbi:MAG: ATP-binding protein [Chlamydiales bacterium]|nr:ATP-binding protein [Chlamydiales bacterium]